jgi:N-acylglucosamine-6-phosphate 2-epimerase
MRRQGAEMLEYGEYLLSRVRNMLERLQRGIIVSAQATHGEPLNQPEYLCALAESALNGGACGLRMAQVENIRYFKQRHPEIPVIGITKPEVIPANAYELVYITPAFSDVASLAPYCEIVALDATLRPRPNGEMLDEIVRRAREDFPDLWLMADIATLPEGLNAARLGFDLISTTLSGYTAETRHTVQAGPDFELLSALVKQCNTPVVLEGRVWEPSEVRRAFDLGAYAVVIGSAVTRPQEITRRFVRASE